jgi:hypothetical protein
MPGILAMFSYELTESIEFTVPKRPRCWIPDMMVRENESVLALHSGNARKAARAAVDDMKKLTLTD